MLRSLRTHRPALAPSLVALALLAACGSPETVGGAPSSPDSRASTSALPTIDVKTEGLTADVGFLTLHAAPDAGTLWLELPPPDANGLILEMLLVESLASGLGSNPIGLDRGRLGPTRLVTWSRHGERVFLEQANLAFRALSDDDAEVRAARDAFATSVLWATDAIALAPDGRCLIDLGGFLTRPARDVVDAIRSAGQGAYRLDAGRSRVDVDERHVFPDNVELEAVLTFTSDDPGREVVATVPAPEAVTLRRHVSWVRLPDDDYARRPFDPRAGAFAVEFLDYAAPLDTAPRTQWARRHRLVKRDPAAARSRPVEPIVYYVDRGAPEPIRSALIEGASWWSHAFEAAGFEDAFRVELLPPDVHPLDVRYNVIHWVHRATRGWSYGLSVSDPRTGEILKGNVVLGSLRVRQDRLLFEGLAGTEATGSGAADDPVELALARIRQLAAHEVGHTLGLAHNFAASTWGRASVMDYPAPLVRVVDDADGPRLDFSEAYEEGVGAWDLLAIRALYEPPPPGGTEAGALAAVLAEARAREMVFLSDADARSPGAAEPRAALWDNGSDAAVALEEALAVRRLALERFDRSRLAGDLPLGRLEQVLAPLYYHHRYQVEAAAKLLGGVYYEHVLASEDEPGPRAVPGEHQRRALRALLAALDPATLDVPEAVLADLAPRAYGDGPTREGMPSSTGPVFDRLASAAAAADLVISAMLHPERCARLVDAHARDPSLPSLTEVLETLIADVFAEPADEAPRLEPVRDVVQRTVVERLVRLARSPSATAHVRAHAEAVLRESPPIPASTREPSLHDALLADDVRRHLERGIDTTPLDVGAPSPPPGSPIGWSACTFDTGEPVPLPTHD